MELAHNSFFCGILMCFLAAFLNAWRESFIGRTVSRIYRFIRRKWENSILFAVAVEGGALRRWWDLSLTQHLLTKLFNCPGTFLRFLDRKCSGKVGNSVIMRFFAYLGEHCEILISWIVLAMLVIPQNYWNNLYSFGAFALVLVLFWIGALKSEKLRIDIKSVGALTAAYALMAAVSFITSDYIALSLRFFVFHLTCMVAVLLMVSSVDSEEKLMRIAAFIFAGLCVACLYGLLQKAMGIEVDEKLVDLSSSGDTPGRVFSFFENPNSYAMILVLFLPLSAVSIIYSKGFMRVLSLAAFLLAALNLALTYSRGGWVAIVIAAFVLVLLMWPRFVPLLIILCLAALPLLPETIYNRLASILKYSSDSSVTSRSALYRVMWEIIKEKPVLGHGLGSDAIQQAVYDSGKYVSEMDFIHGHDLYLQIAGEMGGLGLLAFLGAMIASFRSGLRVITGRNGSRTLQGVTASLIAGFVGLLVYGIIDYPWYFPRVMVLFWVGFGILLSAIKIADGGRKEQ